MSWEGEDGSPSAWWLRDPSQASPPISDRVETEVRDLLEGSPPLTRAELNEALYPRFKEMLAPDPSLVASCLSAYGRQIAPDRWALHQEDEGPSLVLGRRRAASHLIAVGRALGFKIWLAPSLLNKEGKGQPLGDLLEADERIWNPAISHPFHLLWRDGEVITHAFMMSGGAEVIGPLLRGARIDSAECCFALPRRRAPLAAFKLRRLPAPAASLCSFVQWEALGRLADRAELTLQDWRSIQGLEPGVSEDQLELFDASP